jgi:hypothetical protein
VSAAVEEHMAAMSATIQKAIRPLVERVDELESANSILVMRINTQEQAHRALLTELEKLSNADIRLKTLESQLQLNLPGLHDRLNALETANKPEPMTQGYREQFVEHLNNQEWFWDKVNLHIERTIDRLQETADTLDKEKVEEIVREFWADEYENEVNEIAERKAEEAKGEALDEIRDYLRDGLDDKISNALDNFDLDDKLSRILRNATVSIDL